MLAFVPTMGPQNIKFVQRRANALKKGKWTSAYFSTYIAII